MFPVTDRDKFCMFSIFKSAVVLSLVLIKKIFVVFYLGSNCQLFFEQHEN
jgi:hypothetical protein